MIVISDAVQALNAATGPNPVVGIDNIVTRSGITTTTAQTGFPASNLANPSTRPPWKGVANSPLSTEYIEIVVPDGRYVDYVGIADHNWGTIGAAISIETTVSDSPVSWTEIAFGSPASYPPMDDRVLIFQFTRALYTRIRVKIVPGPEATEPPQAGVVYAGDLLKFERSVSITTPHTPLPMGRRSDISRNMSESGKMLGRIVLAQWFESEAAFEFFSDDWYRTYFKPFIDASDESPFFFCWSPEDHPEDCGYVWMRDDPITQVNTMVDRPGVTISYHGIV